MIRSTLRFLRSGPTPTSRGVAAMQCCALSPVRHTHTRTYAPADADFEKRARAVFAAQGAVDYLGMQMPVCEPGHVELIIPYKKELTQQNGFFHGGIQAAIADNACGMATCTLMCVGENPLAAQMNIHFLAPAAGHTLVCVATVLRKGRTQAVCRFEVLAEGQAGGKLVATGTHTCAIAKEGATEARRHEKGHGGGGGSAAPGGLR